MGGYAGSFVAPQEVSKPAAKAPYIQITDRNATISEADPLLFVRRSGQHLVLGSKRFRFAGASNYYMMTRAADPATRPQVLEVLQQAQQLQLTVLRVWAFNDGDSWQSLQPQQGFLDQTVLRDGLDWLISQASKFGVRLVMVTTDSQEGYGGMGQYVRWGGPAAKTIRDFYSSPAIRKAYKAFLGALIHRKNSITGLLYRDDPSILAWEIANSPVCPGDDTGDIMQGWIDDIASHVKNLDGNHLVMLGHSGLFGARSPDRQHVNPSSMAVRQPVVPWPHAYDPVCEGADWARNHESPDIDVAAIQLWPDDWSVAPDAWKLHWVRQWIRQHVEAAQQLGKPLVISAFSKQSRSSRPSLAVRNQMFDLVYREAARSSVIAGTILWLLASSSYPDYDGYTVYTSRVAYEQRAPGWQPISPQDALTAYRRRVFMNWEEMLICSATRVMGTVPVSGASKNTVSVRSYNATNWVSGWADQLDVINSHAQAMAALSQIPLSKAAMSHPLVPRRRYVSPLLLKGRVTPLKTVPANYISPVALRQNRQSWEADSLSGSLLDHSSKYTTSRLSAARADATDGMTGGFLSRLGESLGLSSVFGGGSDQDVKPDELGRLVAQSRSAAAEPRSSDAVVDGVLTRHRVTNSVV